MSVFKVKLSVEADKLNINVQDSTGDKPENQNGRVIVAVQSFIDILDRTSWLTRCTLCCISVMVSVVVLM